jgi:hypothetical protein
MGLPCSLSDQNFSTAKTKPKWWENFWGIPMTAPLGGIFVVIGGTGFPVSVIAAPLSGKPRTSGSTNNGCISD